jgi:type 1 glutamine amidotransferase
MLNRRILPSLVVILCCVFSLELSVNESRADDRDLKILLITGGCCHDYPFQTEALKKAVAAQGVKAEWKVVDEGGKGTKAQISLYDDPKWADGFDVVIHNECFANTTDPDYIRKITKAHKNGVNAVVIHCAMHTYRAAKIDDWREMLGVTSKMHEHQSNYDVKPVDKKHSIMQGFPAKWTTPKDELYVIEQVGEHTTVLAVSVSEKTQKKHPVFWTNEYGKSRVFGTTFGHGNATFEDDVFTKTLGRGILWAAGKLEKK